MSNQTNMVATISGSNVILTWTCNGSTLSCSGRCSGSHTGYHKQRVKRRQNGGSWATVSPLLGGGSTWTDTTATSNNVTYEWFVEGQDPVSVECVGLPPDETCEATWSWNVNSNVSNPITRWADIITETLTMSDSGTSDQLAIGTTVAETLSLSDVVTDKLDAVSVVTETLTLTDAIRSTASLRTDYAYFLGSSDGELYEYSGSNLGDAGSPITSYWRSKATDFSEQYPQYIDDWKTAYGGTLEYVDKDANTAVTLYYSTDGGVTWISAGTNTVGNGDGKTKKTKFYFIKTSDIFDFKIESASADKEFQWIGLMVDFLPRGQHKEIS